MDLRHAVEPKLFHFFNRGVIVHKVLDLVTGFRIEHY
jgi:hypothetical protein